MFTKEEMVSLFSCVDYAINTADEEHPLDESLPELLALREKLRPVADSHQACGVKIDNTAAALTGVIVQCPQCLMVHQIQQIDLAGHWKSGALTCVGCGRIFDLVCKFSLVGR